MIGCIFAGEKTVFHRKSCYHVFSNMISNSLVSQPYFILMHMRVREEGGGKEGKIRLVTYARFSFPVLDCDTSMK